MLKTLLLIITLTVISSASIDFDINKISADANKTNKQVMIFFHKDYCGYCSRMEENLETTQISKLIERDFILLSINRDDDEMVSYQDFQGSNYKFAKKLGLNLYPTLVFIDGNNSIIYDVVGYRKESQISNILKYISSRAYQTMSLELFENNLEFE